jgi:murein DD-endopeptidase MepM/ murein hydrolase activator NlpD
VFITGRPGAPHYGVDIARPVGTPVAAPAAGEVTLAESDLFYSGGTVIIDHGYGLSSSFLHLSQVSVAVGDRVAAGDVLGAVGATGRATGPTPRLAYELV